MSREGDREDGGAGEKPLASRPWKNGVLAGYLKRMMDSRDGEKPAGQWSCEL